MQTDTITHACDAITRMLAETAKLEDSAQMLREHLARQDKLLTDLSMLIAGALTPNEIRSKYGLGAL